MVDVLKLPNQALGDSTSHYRSVWPGVVLLENNTSILLANSGHFWTIASSSDTVVDSRDMNLVFGFAEAIPNK
ncbi:hypothetical protein TNCV_1158921 [Trichonephila clavipes]|nr:hypothetical protein TNCV_1158921 [Trichonephila clavipes]